MDFPYGRVAMVTGGATGIGAAIVEKLADEGLKVACCYNRSKDNALGLQKKMEQKGIDIFIVKIDVTDVASVRSGIKAITEYFGDEISILVNNAGDIIKKSPVEEMDEEIWDTVININLRGAFLCSKYCIPGMKSKGAGRIINMSSISARTGGGSNAAHYVASKGGLEAFTRALAVELAKSGISANSISPGVIYTPIHARHNNADKLVQLCERIPAGRIGEPEEVAGLVSFLCTERAAYITGQMIAVNGGMRLD